MVWSHYPRNWLEIKKNNYRTNETVNVSHPIRPSVSKTPIMGRNNVSYCWASTITANESKFERTPVSKHYEKGTPKHTHLRER